MPFIPQIDEQLALKAALPMDEQIKGFEFGQAQTKAQRETQAYTQQQNQQKALRDIFQNADTSTPEGQADLIRQVGRVDPNAALGLQEQFGKTALQKQQTQESKAKTTEQTALAGEHTEKTLESRRAGFTEAMGEFLRVGTQIQGQYDSDIKSAILPEKAQQKAVESLNQEKQSLAGRFQGNQDVLQILEKMDTSKGYNPQEATQGLAKLKAMVGQLGQQQKPPEGFQASTSGGLAPIPGGPHDLSTIRAEHKAREETPSEAAAKASAVEKAKEVRWGGKEAELLASMTENGVSMPSGLRSKEQIHSTLKGLIDKYPDESADQIAQRIKSGKVELTGLTAEARVAGSQVGKVALAGNEIIKFAPLAESAISKVPRGKWLRPNQLQQIKDEEIQDPNQRQLKVYTTSILNAYDQLASRGGTDAEKRKEQRQNLLTADSPQTYRAALDAMKKEAQLAKEAGKETISEAAGKDTKNKDSALPEGWTVKVH